MKKTLTIITTMAALSACTTLGEVESEALSKQAMLDARAEKPEVHLGYLQCYGLPQSDKKSCRRKAAKLTQIGRDTANTWDYILPFDYEAERLGFKAFLNDAGKKCAGVDQGPQFNEATKAYDVHCTDGNQYGMRFDSEKSEWELVE